MECRDCEHLAEIAGGATVLIPRVIKYNPRDPSVPGLGAILGVVLPVQLRFDVGLDAGKDLHECVRRKGLQSARCQRSSVP